jgi:hypothetical protein
MEASNKVGPYDRGRVRLPESVVHEAHPAAGVPAGSQIHCICRRATVAAVQQAGVAEERLCAHGCTWTVPSMCRIHLLHLILL